MATIIQRLRRNPDLLAVALLSFILGAGSQAFRSGVIRTRVELPLRSRIENVDAGRPRWMMERVRTRLGRLPELEKPRPTRLPSMEF